MAFDFHGGREVTAAARPSARHPSHGGLTEREHHTLVRLHQKALSHHKAQQKKLEGPISEHEAAAEAAAAKASHTLKRKARNDYWTKNKAASRLADQYNRHQDAEWGHQEALNDLKRYYGRPRSK